MKYNIRTEIIIKAPIKEVWHTFKDFQSHDKWNEFIRIHPENVSINRALTVDFLDGDHVKMTMKPRLVKDESYRSFEWMGHLYIRGLFDGHHMFHFEEVDKDTTRFVQEEAFSGILIRPLIKSVLEPTRLQFLEMNTAFKDYTEEKVKEGPGSIL